MDEEEAGGEKEARTARLEAFPETFVPFAEAFNEDMHIAYDFFESLNKGVQILDSTELDPAHKAAWTTAQEFLDARPI